MKGFTLIELLITIAILAIVAVIGFMNLSGYRSERDIKLNTEQIVAMLHDSQNRSFSQESGNRWGVHFENPSGALGFYDLFWTNSTLNYAYATTSIASRGVLPSNIQFNIPAPGSSSTIIFSPVNGLPSASGTIKISLIANPSVSSTINIDTNGGIRY